MARPYVQRRALDSFHHDLIEPDVRNLDAGHRRAGENRRHTELALERGFATGQRNRLARFPPRASRRLLAPFACPALAAHAGERPAPETEEYVAQCAMQRHQAL